MSGADFEQQQAEDERLALTLEALEEMRRAGMKDGAEFLARELGVSKWFKEEKRNGQDR